MGKVAIVGAGLTRFSASRYDASQEEMVAEAMRQAAENMGMTWNDLRNEVDMGVGAYCSDFFNQQLKFGATIHDYLGLCPKSNIRVEAVGATGAQAIRTGYAFIAASTLYDVIAVLSWEKMSEVSYEQSLDFLGRNLDLDFEYYPVGVTLPTVHGMMAQLHMKKFGTSREQIAKIAVKNRKNALNNPFVDFGKKMAVKDILISKPLFSPLRELDFAPASDGAAVLIMTSEDKAKKFTDTPIWISGTGCGTDNFIYRRTADDIPILASTRVAAEQAYKMAGISNPMKELDCAEVYDMSTIYEIMAYESLGFCGKGEGGKLIEDGATESGGELPVNVAGGCFGAGTALAAIGVKQAVEMFWQLRGEADKRLKSGAQVQDAEKGLINAESGYGVKSVVHILEK
nr:thiolase domain-containing protein [Candidatus Njordarchaeota archaeon]